MVDDTTQKECRRVYYRRVGARLGPEIVTAPFIEESPLYRPAKEAGNPPEVDKTQSNLFLKGYWGDLLPHLKWAFVCKFGDSKLENFYFHIVTDERLKEVWLSKESYISKSKKKRDEVQTFNNLAELIGTSYHLVIIRLGFLGHKNSAMAGILLEALKIRQAAQLPTWIVEEPDSLFEPGHFAYSPIAQGYIAAQFETIDLTKSGGDGPVAQRGREGAPLPEEPGLAIDKEESPPTYRSKGSPRPPADLDMSMLEGGPKKSTWKSKKSGGKGPMGGDL